MKERINELADYAGASFGKRLEFAVVFGEMEDFEKFVEFIVKECANVCESMPLIGPYKEVQDTTLKDAALQIREHFGVEE